MGHAPLLITAHELHVYDEPGKHVELVRGRLLVHEPPGFVHGDVVQRIGFAIGLFLHPNSPRVWRVVVGDTGFWVQRDPDTVRAPDIAYVREEQIPAAPVYGFAEFPPDLAVEVRSPNDRTGALLGKVADWISAGAALVWVVDPARRTAQVYRPDGSITLLGVPQALDGEGVLPGFTLPLASLFD